MQRLVSGKKAVARPVGFERCHHLQHTGCQLAYAKQGRLYGSASAYDNCFMPGGGGEGVISPRQKIEMES